MTRRVMVLMVVVLLAAASCGGDDDSSNPAFGSDPNATTDGGEGTGDGGGGDGGGQSDGSSLEPIGPVDMNTIQIGSETWERTLPMTTGQCFLYEDDGSLPTSAVVWGTLNGDDEIRFSATYGQDGVLEAEVRNDTDMYWIAGERNPNVNDLVIELDFDTLTVTGHGTFSSLTKFTDAAGAFAFQCEPENE